jgi:tRNA G10  N-methylase Trm11
MDTTNLELEQLETELLEELDDSWILEFENIEDEYKYFYKENIQTIKVRYMYINKENYLEKIKEENIILNTPNILSREEIVTLVKNNNKINNTQYTLLSLLKYNIDLEPINLKTFLKTTNKPNYLTSIKTIDTIYFSPSIYMFQDLNDVFIIFYEPKENTTNKNSTNLNNLNNSTNSPCNKSITKKIFIRPVAETKNRTYKKLA